MYGALSEYLDEHPSLAGLVWLAMLLVSVIAWIQLMHPSRPIGFVLADPWFWAIALGLGIPMAVYLVVSMSK